MRDNVYTLDIYTTFRSQCHSAVMLDIIIGDLPKKTTLLGLAMLHFYSALILYDKTFPSSVLTAESVAD